MTYELAYGSEIIRYQVNWVPARRTLAIEVHPDERVIVRAPVGCAGEVIAARMKKRAGWISRQIADFQRYRPRTPPRRYVSGETQLYLGRQYRLKVTHGESSGVRMIRGYLLVTVQERRDSAAIRTLLQGWYLSRAKTVFKKVLEECLPRFRGLLRPDLVARDMRSRWGSLSAGGRMTLNVNLVRAPRECIEYVVTHELCHLLHRNHDVRFFRLLGRVMPDWQKRKQRLEEALI